MAEPVVVAASISAIGVAIAGLLAWLMNLSVRNAAKAHEQELAKLQGEIRTTEERLRSSLARELASHESVLRVREELRLKLFVLAAESVSSTSSVIAKATIFFARYLGGSNVQTSEVEQFSEQLLAAANFLPPELEKAHETAVALFAEKLAQCGGASPTERAELRAEVMHEIGFEAAKFSVAANVWKRRHWDEFETKSLGSPTKATEDA